MSEIAKVEALRAHNPKAADLAHLLLQGDSWALVNDRVQNPLRISAARLIVDLLGIDFEAYQLERIDQLGIADQNIALALSELALRDHTEGRLPSIDEVLDRVIASGLAAAERTRAELAAGPPTLTPPPPVLV